MFAKFKESFVGGNIGFARYINASVNPTLPAWRAVSWRDGLTSANIQALGLNVLDAVVSIGASAFKASTISNPYWELSISIVMTGEFTRNLSKLLHQNGWLPQWTPTVAKELTLLIGFTQIANSALDGYVLNDITFKTLSTLGQQIALRNGFDTALANRITDFSSHCLVLAGREAYNTLTRSHVVKMLQSINLMSHIRNETTYVKTPSGFHLISQTVSFEANNTLHQRTTEYLGRGWNFILGRLSPPSIFAAAETVVADPKYKMEVLPVNILGNNDVSSNNLKNIMRQKLNIVRDYLYICDADVFSKRGTYQVGDQVFDNINLVQYAILINRTDVFPTFKEVGVDFTQRDSDGNTLLHTAMMLPEDRTWLAQFLLDNHAAINILNKVTKTALDIAYGHKGSEQAQNNIKFLESRGALWSGWRPKECSSNDWGKIGGVFFISVGLSPFLFFARNLLSQCFSNQQMFRTPRPQQPTQADAEAKAENSARGQTSNTNGENAHNSVTRRRQRPQENTGEEVQQTNNNTESKEAEPKRLARENIIQEEKVIQQKEKLTAEAESKIKDIRGDLLACTNTLVEIKSLHDKIIDFNKNIYAGYLERNLKPNDVRLQDDLLACSREVQHNFDMGIISRSQSKIIELLGNLDEKLVTPLLDELKKYYDTLNSKYENLLSKAKEISEKDPIKKKVQSYEAAAPEIKVDNDQAHDTEKPVRINKFFFTAPANTNSGAKGPSVKLAPAKTSTVVTRNSESKKGTEYKKYLCEYVCKMAVIYFNYKAKGATDRNTEINKKNTALALAHLLIRINLVLMFEASTSVEREEKENQRTAYHHALKNILENPVIVIASIGDFIAAIEPKFETALLREGRKKINKWYQEILDLINTGRSKEELDNQVRKDKVDRFFDIPTDELDALVRRFHGSIISNDRFGSNQEQEDEGIECELREKLIPEIIQLWFKEPVKTKTKTAEVATHLPASTVVPDNLFPLYHDSDVSAALVMFAMIGERHYKGKKFADFIKKCSQLGNMEHHEVVVSTKLRVAKSMPIITERHKSSYLLVEATMFPGAMGHELAKFFYINNKKDVFEVDIIDVPGLRDALDDLIKAKKSPNFEDKKHSLFNKYRMLIHESLERKAVRELCMMAYKINTNKSLSAPIALTTASTSSVSSVASPLSASMSTMLSRSSIEDDDMSSVSSSRSRSSLAPG